MASVTPAAGTIGLALGGPGGATFSAPAIPSLDAACVVRIGPVRILRGGWRGVALRVAYEADERFELALTAGDGRSITVASVHQDDAVALWRDCGRASGLSLMLQGEDGALSEPYPQIGRVALGPLRIRRRHGALASRRPRFLSRRKTGRLPDRPVVFAGERPFE